MAVTAAASKGPPRGQQQQQQQQRSRSRPRRANLQLLRYDDGAVQFRQRIVVSILSCRPLLIRNIRHDDISSFGPGLRPHEASFLRLIDSVTNGSKIEINNTGTQLKFVPGVLTGGDIEHVCPTSTADEEYDDDDDDNNLNQRSRSIGWFLEGILPLAPFGKEPLLIKFNGITDGCSSVDPSSDYLKSTVLPLMSLFGIGDAGGGGPGSGSGNDNDFLSPQAPHIRIIRRCAAPGGIGENNNNGGYVEFYCPNVKELKPIDYVDPGKIKRIRGLAISCKIVSSSMAARVAYASKGVFQRLIPDVWIHTDCHTQKHHKCGPNPGLSLVISAESTSGCIMSAECCFDYSSNYKNKKKELPEDLGQRGACMLLDEIRKGGCIDTGVQSLALLWMCLCPEDVSRIRLGTISEYTIESLRLYKSALGVEFKITAEPETKTVLLSCLGTGYRNMARAST